MSLTRFLRVEVAHDLGFDDLWVIGPIVRLGSGALPPCDLRGSSGGGWIEVQLDDSVLSVISSFGATRNGAALNSTSEIAVGETITIGNSIVRFVEIAYSVPSDAPAHQSYAPQLEQVSASNPAPPPDPVWPSEPIGVYEPVAAIASTPASAPVVIEVAPPDSAAPGAGKRAWSFLGGLMGKDESEQAKPTEQAAPPAPSLVIFEKGSVSRVELGEKGVVAGSDKDSPLRLAGERVAPAHLEFSCTGGEWRVKVLAGFDRTTIAGRFVREGALPNGTWIVAGGSRMRFDAAPAPFEDTKPPAKLSYGAIFSPLARLSDERESPVAGSIVKMSPVMVFSIVFHVLVMGSLIFFTINTKGEQVSVDLSAAFEPPPPVEEIIEEPETEFEEILDEWEEELEEEFLEQMEIIDTFQEAGPDSFLDGPNLPLAPVDGGYGPQRLPSRPKKGGPRGKPTISEIRRRGLDLTFVFDTTASMDYLLDDVKRSIEAIHSITFELVKSTRFACVAYRDVDPLDDYVVRHFDFTNELLELKDFVNRLGASGGGDFEEAVQEALQKVGKLKWRKDSHKVVILFTDAPSHKQNEKQCMKWAENFRTDGGYLHTVHVKTAAAGSKETAAFLSELARAGGGTFEPLSEDLKVLRKVLQLVFPEDSIEVQKAIEQYEAKRGAR